MPLIDFIQKLQQKPRYVRVQIMWVGVTVCMTLILVFWIWSLNASLSSVADKQTSPATDNLKESWRQLKTDIPTLWQSMGAGINNILGTSGTITSPAPAAGAVPIIDDGQTRETLPIE